eukprot:386359_1
MPLAHQYVAKLAGIQGATFTSRQLDRCLQVLASSNTEDQGFAAEVRAELGEILMDLVSEGLLYCVSFSDVDGDSQNRYGSAVAFSTTRALARGSSFSS